MSSMDKKTKTRAKKPVNKLVLGFAAAAITALIGASSMVSAHSAPSQTNNGYGGGGSANLDLDLDIRGDDNIINIIVNFFLG